MQDNVIERALEGDLNAINALISQNQDMIFNSIFYMVRDHNAAEDLTQTVFLKALKNLKSYNEKAKFSTWLYAIAINTVKNYRRYEAKRRHLSMNNPANCNDDDKTPEFKADVP